MIEKKQKIIVYTSFILNILFIIALVILCVRFIIASKVFTKEDDKTENRDEFISSFLYDVRKWDGYYLNPYYDASITTYVLNEEDGPVDIIFLGDSITYYGEWGEWFDEKKVLNRGIRSDTSEGVLNRIDEITFINPQKVFLMIGINDISDDGNVEDVIENITEICERIHMTNPTCIIYLQSVLPQINFDNRIIKQLNVRIRKISYQNENIKYIDLYDMFDSNGEIEDRYYSEDQLHLNGEGYKCWISAVYPYVIE